MLHEIAGQSTALGLILAAWLLSIGGCIGLGLLWQRAWGVHTHGGERIFAAFWIGLALAMGALQLWHFLVPVNLAAAACLLAIGGFGLVRERAALPALRPASASQWAALGATLLGVLWVAHRCMRPLEHYDTGLYLLAAMTWIGDEALMPGLANLHGRLGFNNAHLLFAALFDMGPWTNRSPNLLNGCLLTVFFAGCLHAGRNLFGASRARAGAAFAWLIIPPAMILASRYMVSLSSDLPATLFSLLVAWRAFRLLAGEVEGAVAQRAELRDLTLLAAAGICIKLSSLVFLGGVWLTAVFAVFPNLRQRDLLISAAIGFALLGPWLVRNAVLSGYPLYPIALISIPIDWRVPVESVDHTASLIKIWARVPGGSSEIALVGWQWLESWTQRNLVLQVGVRFPLPVLLGTFGAILVAAGRTFGRSSPAARGLWLLAPSTLAFMFWFWTAPDPRFAMFVFWSIAAAGIAAAIGVWSALPAPRFCVVALATALSLVSAPRDTIRSGTERGFHPLPVVEIDQFKTASGLKVNVPVGSDKCWGTRPPCTPYPRADLRLRDRSALRSGFARGH